MIPQLTSVRLFAAFHVVLLHTFFVFLPDVYVPGWVRNFINLGYVSVSLFFVLSGYILASNYLKKPLNRKEFWVARFARVYPLYLISLFAMLPFVLAFRLEKDIAPVALFKLGVSAIAVFGMIQAWHVPVAGFWNFPAWSLSVEAFLYATFPFLARPMVRVAKSWPKLTATALFIAVFAPAIASTLAHNINVGFIPLLRLPEFLFGIALWAWDNDALVKYGKAMLFSALGWGILIIAFKDSIPAAVTNALLIPSFCLLILGLRHSNGSIATFFSAKSLVFFGEASYAMYLLHIPILYWFKLFTIPGSRLSRESFYAGNHGIMFAAYLVLLFSICATSFVYLETPSRRFLRRILSKQSAFASEPHQRLLPIPQTPQLQEIHD